MTTAVVRRRHAAHPGRRCIGLLVALVLCFAAVVVRLVSLQVVAPAAYVERGQAQRLHTITLPAERGSIFDRDGNELAMSVRQKTVWADARLVTDPVGEAAAAAQDDGPSPSPWATVKPFLGQGR